MKQRSPITTHILDLGRGKAAAGVPVYLYKKGSTGEWQSIEEGTTDADGRIETFFPAGSRAETGVYQLHFDTDAYFTAQGMESFYPQVEVTFRIVDSDRHHHVPLLLNSYGYSTYRGT